MRSGILFIGAIFLVFMTIMTWASESFPAGRPYAAASIMMVFIASASYKRKE